MNEPSLKKILSKKEIARIIDHITQVSNTEICIKDPAGNRLRGSLPLGASPTEYPICVDGRIAGYISSNSDITQVVAIISHIINSECEKRAIAAETIEKYREINMLYNIGEKLSACLEVRDICSFALTEAVKFIKAEGGSVIIENNETKKLETAAIYLNDYSVTAVHKLNRGKQGPITFVPKAIVVKRSEIEDPHSELRNFDTIVCAPIKSKTRVVGVISLNHSEAVNYSAEEVKFLCALAYNVSFSLGSAALYEELREAFGETIKTLIEITEKHDPKNSKHAQNVARVCLQIGEKLGLNKSELSVLRFAALMHDIGKSKTSESDYEMHPVYGAQIIQHIKRLKEVIPAILHHHENYDGSGFPSGLAGDTIPLYSRIIAVADFFTHNHDDILFDRTMTFYEMKKSSGRLFDPKMIDIITKIY